MSTAFSYAADIRGVQIIAGEDNLFVRNIASALVDILQQSDPGLEVKVSPIGTTQREEEKKLVVLIGERAAGAASNTVGAGAVVAMLSRRAAIRIGEGKYPVSTIYFEQPFNRLLNLAKLADLKRRSDQTVLGIVASEDLQNYLTGADVAASERKQTLHIETVDSELAVGRAVAKLVKDADVLLAVPDPMVHTANTVQPILLLTYRAGVPVIGYSAAYLRAGAALALYSTPEQLARQAADTIAAFRAGKPQPVTQSPRYFTVGINPTVARSLDITLPDTETLEKKLRAMKE